MNSGSRVDDFRDRGVYRVAMRGADSSADAPVTSPNAKGANPAANGTGEPKPREELIAANGQADESKLAAIDESGAMAKLKGDGRRRAPAWHWVPRGEPISLTAPRSGAKTPGGG